jgi:SAM-dependent methyltransferase
MRASITDDERAGAVEPFQDAALYDWEYRRRRSDVAFYRMLAGERGGPILDLGCGTGRLTLPLARDGHNVVGIDLSKPMLARARQRVQRAARPVAQRCLIMRADLRSLPIRGHFPLVIAAFHTVQHLVDDGDLLALFRAVRRAIAPDGWFAFDLFSPNPIWLNRSPGRQYDRTVFRHPITGQRLAYSLSHHLDGARRALHMKVRYQPVTPTGAPAGRARSVRLCHRQLAPADVAALLTRAGLRIIGRWDGFDGEPQADPGAAPDPGSSTEQQVYLAAPIRRRKGS